MQATRWMMPWRCCQIHVTECDLEVPAEDWPTCRQPRAKQEADELTKCHPGLRLPRHDASAADHCGIPQ